MAAFVAALLVAGWVVAPTQRPALTGVGQDFLPFYAAGTLLRDGRPHDIYNLDALRAREQEIANASGVPIGDGFGPFWNPPFYAMPFAPLSVLPFRPALLTWLGVNLFALLCAMILLGRLVAQAAPNAGWRTWGLIPLLVLVSTPFFLALTHGQNTFCSLLLLTLATLAWRTRRAVLTGLVLGLLAYKPQLAALVGLVAVIDLGWRVALGAALSGGVLLLAAAIAMPGILDTYNISLPQMLHFMQVEHVYLWHRHVTLKAFWRLLLQGFAIGETSLAVNLLAVASAGVLVFAVFAAAVRTRLSDSILRRDRLITATVAAMPLVMPFYFDYDLLLLAIPAVLYASERLGQGSRQISRMKADFEHIPGTRSVSLPLPPGEGWGEGVLGGRTASAMGTPLHPPISRKERGKRHEHAVTRPHGIDRLVIPAWSALYVWMTINPDVAERTRINGAVPLLAILASCLVARALRRTVKTAQCAVEPPGPIAAAA